MQLSEPAFAGGLGIVVDLRMGLVAHLAAPAETHTNHGFDAGLDSDSDLGFCTRRRWDSSPVGRSVHGFRWTYTTARQTMPRFVYDQMEAWLVKI